MATTTLPLDTLRNGATSEAHSTVHATLPPAVEEMPVVPPGDVSRRSTSGAARQVSAGERINGSERVTSESGAASVGGGIRIESMGESVHGTRLSQMPQAQKFETSSVEPPTPSRAEGLEPTEALFAELKSQSDEFETADAETILRWAVDRFGDRLTMGTAFGPEGMVILHLLGKINPRTHVFNLDTGYQFAETLALRDQVAARYGIEVEMLRPEQTVEEYERQHGGPLYKTDPNQCCFDRKIKVLQRAARGRHAWISAIRRDQSADRGRADIIGWDKKFGLVKVNPLANWTKKDVWKLITDQQIPYNPLHDRGYTSIGCWPCTRATLFGEDERAGRWSGFAKTECGLHSTE